MYTLIRLLECAWLLFSYSVPFKRKFSCRSKLQINLGAPILFLPSTNRSSGSQYIHNSESDKSHPPIYTYIEHSHTHMQYHFPPTQYKLFILKPPVKKKKQEKEERKTKSNAPKHPRTTPSTCFMAPFPHPHRHTHTHRCTSQADQYTGTLTLTHSLTLSNIFYKKKYFLYSLDILWIRRTSSEVVANFASFCSFSFL